MLSTLRVVGIFMMITVMGCSPQEQDIADEDNQAIIAFGAVIDPYISHAVVFADYNGDGLLTSYEPWAYTDHNGYFSIGKDGETYCKTSSRYCLTLPNNSTVKLLAVGGYDISTQQQMQASMSRQYSGAGMQYITPLTSVGELAIDDENTIEANQDVMLDAFAGEGTLFSVAFNTHKLVELLTTKLINQYPALAQATSLPVNVSEMIYQEIERLAREKQLSLIALLNGLTDEDIYRLLHTSRRVLDDVESIKSVDKARNTMRKSPSAVSDDGQTVAQVKQLLASLSSMHTLLSEISLEDGVTGQLRMMQIVANAISALPEEQSHTTVEVLATRAADEAFLQTLSQASYDAKYFSVIDSQAQLDNAMALMAARMKFPVDLTHQQVLLRFNSEQRDGVVTFYFDQVSQGNLTACVAFNNKLDPSDPQNTKGIVLQGIWEKSDYQLNMILDIAGTEQVLRMTTQAGNSYSFDLDGSDGLWQSDSDFIPLTGDIPTTNAQCRERLDLN